MPEMPVVVVSCGTLPRAAKRNLCEPAGPKNDTPAISWREGGGGGVVPLSIALVYLK